MNITIEKKDKFVEEMGDRFTITSVIKRNGSTVPFDSSKIRVAIEKAFRATNVLNDAGQMIQAPFTEDQLDNITRWIMEDIQKTAVKKGAGETIHIEDIQDSAQHMLMKNGSFEVADAFTTYRYRHALARHANTTDESILSLIECCNEELAGENANKNPVVNSTQRDYMAGEVSRDISARLLLPDEVIEAHKQGLIHFHDMDYYAQHMHNCFSGDTCFVTDRGVRAFNTCRDGELVSVLSKDGEWSTATVHLYGKQAMQEVTLSAERTVKTVKCTANHRWILKDGSVTTDLKVGDQLYCLREMKETEITDKHAFCFGMIIGDGCDVGGPNRNSGLRIRLCGEKTAYAPIFEECGYFRSSQTFENGDMVLTKTVDARKSTFIENAGWRYLSPESQANLFRGYYAADGVKDAHRISTANPDVAQMIREISCTAGYHITSERLDIRDTNFKKDAKLYTFQFMISQPENRNWIVKDIHKFHSGTEYNAWCVEEPKTHSFTLEGGVVTGNCDLVNLEDMLQNGTVISGTMIEKPHSFSTACNIATQIVAQVASNQYGGQSISLAHLAPFVNISRKKIRKKVEAMMKRIIPEDQWGTEFFENAVTENTEAAVRTEVRNGVQTIQYQVLTLLTTNGQTPFITVFMYLGEAKNEQERKDLALIIEETLKQRILGIKNEKGEYVTPAFPKLIYVLQENNITPDAPYYYLTQLAAECSAKRMVPDYISEKKMLELKGDVYTCMGCRSFLTPDRFTEAGIGNIANAKNYKEGEHKYYGRFNQGVVTINLVDVALSSGKDMDQFWKIFDERLDICHTALRCRHERLLGTKSDVAPILWQHGALARLEKGEKIDKLLFNGYSTISLGYAGLYECVKYMTGKSHTDPEATPFAIQVMQHMNDACQVWKKAENIDYSLYGTPLESTTYKFAKCLKARFGEIEDITDHGYITNSYHINVREPIDAFSKLAFESQFQALSPGGAISYVEIPNMQNNLEAVLQLIRYIYDNILYAELNTKSDYCQCCGYNGEIKIITLKDGKLGWECPNCGNRDQNKMNVARRTCGYIGTQFWNQGRTEEIRDRVLHL